MKLVLHNVGQHILDVKTSRTHLLRNEACGSHARSSVYLKHVDNIVTLSILVAFMESDEVMIEQYLKGTEISIGCYKTRDKSVVFPATEVVTENEFFDYNAKYNGQVQEITPARINPDTAKRVADEVSRIYDVLHCNGIIRIDFIITKGLWRYWAFSPHYLGFDTLSYS